MNTSTPGAKGRSHFNLPNTLTWLRILMIPAILILYYLPFWWADPAACAAFALAGITDTLDGYYARKLGLTSRLGAFLDPVADKLIVAAAGADRQQGSALVRGHDGHHHHRPRDRGLGAARMDG
jgi:phosphatidylglycerophosphate synthase